MPSDIFNDDFNNTTGFSDPSNAYANERSNWITFNYVFAGSNEIVRFKAFITDFKDNYAVTWNEEQVYGRNDPIVTFQNTVRTITLAWVAPASSMGEGYANLKRAAKLMRYCYPTYQDNSNLASTISKPPLIRVQFKNFMKNAHGQGLLVAIGGFDFAPVIEDGFWDAGKEGKAAGVEIGDTLVPKTLQFSCTMKIIHEEGIGWEVSPPSQADIDKALKNNKPIPVAYSQWGSDGKYPYLQKGNATVDANEQEKYESLGGAWVSVYDNVKKTTLEYWEKRAQETAEIWGSENMDTSDQAKAEKLAFGATAAERHQKQNLNNADNQKAQREQQIKEMQSLGVPGSPANPWGVK